LKELQAGLKINSEVPQAYFDLGNTYLKLNQYSDAIVSYEKAIALQADFWPATNNIGLIQYEEGKIDQAVSKWREALTVDENQAEPTLAIAVALYKQGQRQEAIKLGQQALRTDNNYGKLEFLEENLWGKKLLADTSEFFQNPAISKLLPSQ
jgi:tetratricopeptide (TPR) repeat protein